MIGVIEISSGQIEDFDRILDNAEDWAISGKEVADVMKRNLFRLLDSTGQVSDLSVLLAAANFRTADARKVAAFRCMELARSLRTEMARGADGSLGLILRLAADLSEAGAEFVRLDKELGSKLDKPLSDVANS